MQAVSFFIRRVNRLRESCLEPQRIEDTHQRVGRPARLRVSGRQQRQRHHLGGAGRCPAGYAGRLSQARRHVAATPAAAGGRPAHASHRGRRQSLVLPVCIDPESRGCGIRGRLARLRLERPDDSLQASAAGRWPRCQTIGVGRILFIHDECQAHPAEGRPEGLPCPELASCPLQSPGVPPSRPQSWQHCGNAPH